MNPQWGLNLEWREDGTITSVEFKIDTWHDIHSAEDAAHDLMAVLLWWLDTKQYIHHGLAAEGL